MLDCAFFSFVLPSALVNHRGPHNVPRSAFFFDLAESSFSPSPSTALSTLPVSRSRRCRCRDAPTATRRDAISRGPQRPLRNVDAGCAAAGLRLRRHFDGGPRRRGLRVPRRLAGRLRSHAHRALQGRAGPGQARRLVLRAIAARPPLRCGFVQPLCDRRSGGSVCALGPLQARRRERRRRGLVWHSATPHFRREPRRDEHHARGRLHR